MTLRPDLVLTSDCSKQGVLLELTVPWEDWLEEGHKHKKAKYLKLVEQCRRHGWKACCEPIEVGCRGFVGQSLHQTLSLLGIRGLWEREATENITEAVEKAPRWLQIKKFDLWWSTSLGSKLGTDHPGLHH